MKTISFLTAATLLIVSLQFLHPQLVPGQAQPPETPELLKKGKELYGERCVGCHGVQGDGQTPLREILKPPPRDFTEPLGNWTVTKGEPAKIFKVIKEGIAGSSMMHFNLPDQDIWALVVAVRSFSVEKKPQ